MLCVEVGGRAGLVSRPIISDHPNMPPASTIQLEFPEPDIAQLTFDDPAKGANVLSSGVLAEFSAHLEHLEQRPRLSGLIIRSGKRGSFIAAADLHLFVALLDPPQEQLVPIGHRWRRSFR